MSASNNLYVGMYRGPVVKRAGPNNKRNDNVVHRERDIRVTRWAVISYVK